jgi:hypothetical protein
LQRYVLLAKRPNFKPIKIKDKLHFLIILRFWDATFRGFPNNLWGLSLFLLKKTAYLCSVNKLKHGGLSMKKSMMMLFASVLLFVSCGTYAGQGAMTGATFGSIIGSAIGGMSGGWRGSNMGQIVGMAGGAAVGAAIGAQADQQEREKIEKYRRERQRRYSRDADYEGVDAVYENGDVREVRP